MTKLKMIAVSLSRECIKEPRCAFCYLDDPVSPTINRLLGQETGGYDWFDLPLVDHVLEVLKPRINLSTILCVEYNGYGLSTIDWICKRFPVSITITMTTMPQAITPVLVKYLKHLGISAVALSFDSEKVRIPRDWLIAANMLTKENIPVSCNYLIEPHIGVQIPGEVFRGAGQLNLLGMKPNQPYSPKQIEALRNIIEVLKGRIPVAVDNCLGVQLGFTDHCGAGEEFVHFTPEMQMQDCSFQSQCYLWREEWKKN